MMASSVSKHVNTFHFRTSPTKSHFKISRNEVVHLTKLTLANPDDQCIIRKYNSMFHLFIKDFDRKIGIDTFRKDAPCKCLVICTDLFGNILSEYPSTWDYFWTQKMKYGI